MNSIEGITVGRLLLAEYDRVKEEQKTRIGFRDNLIYVTLAAVVTVLIGMTQTHRLTLLLVLPVATSVLGWTYLANDEKISAIGRYVRTDLGPRLGELVGDQGYMFEWELAHRSDARRRQRKILQCMVDLIIFCALPLVALAAFWCGASVAPLAVVVSALEALAVVVLGAQIVLYAEIAA
ncbi:hypothetical protein ACH4OT_17085 [Streptomyces murinus]|uniref:hypothetical protein n=1 Tax=Streptomyces murinus TaxID=33900 RepID=UPI002E8104EC|nr:hypothetical protein [Streptomyces murinus]